MFIAHLPAGYLITKFVCRHFHLTEEVKQKVMTSGLLGAIAPDLDLLYLYFIDNFRDHHHSYWSHYPIVWLLLLFMSLGLFRVFDKGYLTYGFFAFSLNGFFHLVLDSMAGEIRWLVPFDSNGYSLIALKSVYAPWVLNFLLHWSFLVELLILLLFCHSLYRSRVVR